MQPARIVILADSLALPRSPDLGDISYEQTYPLLLDQLLRQRYGTAAPLVIERGMRFRTIKDVLFDWYEQVTLKQASIVIVHVGIVDCAPRVLLPWERRLLSGLRPWGLREAILRFIHKHRRTLMRLRPNRVYVSEKDFRAGIQAVVQQTVKDRVAGLLFVNIVTPPTTLDNHSPGIAANVARYNHILSESVTDARASIVDLDGLLQRSGGVEQLTVDGMHINAAGHRLLADELAARVNALLPLPAPVSVPA